MSAFSLIKISSRPIIRDISVSRDSISKKGMLSPLKNPESLLLLLYFISLILGTGFSCDWELDCRCLCGDVPWRFPCIRTKGGAGGIFCPLLFPLAREFISRIFSTASLHWRANSLSSIISPYKLSSPLSFISGRASNNFRILIAVSARFLRSSLK